MVKAFQAKEAQEQSIQLSYSSCALSPVQVSRSTCRTPKRRVQEVVEGLLTNSGVKSLRSNLVKIESTQLP